MGLVFDEGHLFHIGHDIAVVSYFHVNDCCTFLNLVMGGTFCLITCSNHYKNHIMDYD